MLEELKALLISKRFLAILASVIMILFKNQLPVSEEQLIAVLAMVFAWVLGDSVRPTFNGPRQMLVLILALGFASSASAQISSTVSSAFVVKGIEGFEVVAGLVVVPEGSKPLVSQVGIVDVDCDAAIIRVTAEDSKRKSVETKQVEQGKFLVLGNGQIWVRIICVDFDKKIFEDTSEVITIGNDPAPDEPDTPDNPEPLPTPDVAPDAFDNLGQRVASWSAGLPGRKAVAAVYRESAEMLRSDPSQTVNSVSSYLVGKLSVMAEYSQFVEVRKNINADLQQRWSASPMSRGVLADYYAAIATGLEAE